MMAGTYNQRRGSMLNKVWRGETGETRPMQWRVQARRMLRLTTVGQRIREGGEQWLVRQKLSWRFIAKGGIVM